MAGSTYLPVKEGALLVFSANFERLLTLDPAKYGLVPKQATDFAALQAAFAAAYQTANESQTRSPANVQIKNTAKKAMIENIRELVPIIQAFPGTTDDDRSALEITIRDSQYTPVPVPSTMPRITILSSLGLSVEFKVNDVDEERRGRPPEAAAAMIYSWVGDEPPTDLRKWFFQGASTTVVNDAYFPEGTAPGSQVWISAFWVNRKMEAGPACQPVPTNIPGGGASMAA